MGFGHDVSVMTFMIVCGQLCAVTSVLQTIASGKPPGRFLSEFRNLKD